MKSDPVKLRDLPGPLEAALTRLRAVPERDTVVVVDVLAEAEQSGLFVQYYGGAGRALFIQLVLNSVSRQIPGIEKAAGAFFGGLPEAFDVERAAEFFGEPPGAFEAELAAWSKPCSSVVQAVEFGMHVLRQVLLIDWSAMVSVAEITQETEVGL